MQLQTEKRYYTPEEYLEQEEKAEYKHEYRDGEIVPMTGGTTNHNKIALNFAANLKFGLKGQDYDIYIGDVRLWIPRYRQYTYPDVMVIEGEPIYLGTGKTTVVNPSLLVEVLSKSTKNYDLGDKFIYYRSIPEFKEYILIDQAKYHVMQYAKNSHGQWLLREQESADAILQLSSIEFQINLQDIYEKVNFADSEE
ncbi:MAG: Uma2 family endonuclease [Symploca sp. SIO2E6]|nr:Uma2 family endonuclease [Symploca sp. SIO2E6]